ncbi:hypothetical protein CUMW_221710 [Citrus unshiu]|uniref:Uncharacterized protein n=1 Tax=Citrus unshiu TaxID=55188 RepID=A0A2H5QE78_CITUN|nr:hypothetical protein CUMW_221710 [Citrus unshiu]
MNPTALQSSTEHKRIFPFSSRECHRQIRLPTRPDPSGRRPGEMYWPGQRDWILFLPVQLQQLLNKMNFHVVLSKRSQLTKQQGHDHELDDQLGLHASRSDNLY